MISQRFTKRRSFFFNDSFSLAVAGDAALGLVLVDVAHVERLDEAAVLGAVGGTSGAGLGFLDIFRGGVASVPLVPEKLRIICKMQKAVSALRKSRGSCRK